MTPVGTLSPRDIADYLLFSLWEKASGNTYWKESQRCSADDIPTPDLKTSFLSMIACGDAVAYFNQAMRATDIRYIDAQSELLRDVQDGTEFWGNPVFPGLALKAYRVFAGISLIHTALSTGLCIKHISQVERGIVELSASELYLICTCLNIPVTAIGFENKSAIYAIARVLVSEQSAVAPGAYWA